MGMLVINTFFVIVIIISLSISIKNDEGSNNPSFTLAWMDDGGISQSFFFLSSFVVPCIVFVAAEVQSLLPLSVYIFSTRVHQK